MAFLLEDYKDIQEIARGGMGKVYLATQISLNRKVIIKEMAAGLLTDITEIKRFENEARAAAALDHDNIIRIYDFGEDRGSFYISMEYIDGPDLEGIVKDRVYVPEIALMILLQALKGLDFAHQRHIIHRDIKPGNILISKTGAVKVVDFGLAHAGKQQLHLTATDIIVGTPLFMSPEQATGEERKDIRMDIWAVGVLLYRIITGRYPFSGDNVPAILFNIVQTKEPPIETLAPTLPDDLVQRINQCLEKDRSKRLRSLAPLIESLQNYFYEIGIKDPVERIRTYINEPAACTRELSKVLHDFHERKSNARVLAGDDLKAGAHLREAKKYDSMNHPISRTINVIKKYSSSSGISKLRCHTASLFASLPLFGKIAVISAIMLAAVGTGFFIFQKAPTVKEPVSGLKSSSTALSEARPPVPAEPSTGTTERTLPPPADTSVTTEAVRQLSAPGAGVKSLSDQKRAPVEKLYVPKNGAKASVPPATGLLRVAIIPLFAEVTVDGDKLSPREMSEGKRLKPGEHTLLARADGYQPYVKTVVVEKNAVQIVSADLIPYVKGTASVHIHSYPWAEVYIDGEFRGTTPTPKPIPIPEGTHSVALKRDGYTTHKEEISVTAGELRRMKVQLTKR